MLLDLTTELGLELHKSSSAKGGEFHGPCPNCGEGKDRFVLWPSLNRYWCRRCNTKGDAIQFCRDFLKLSYREALEKTQSKLALISHKEKSKIRLSIALEPPQLWQEKALAFADWAAKQLHGSAEIQELHARGLKTETINRFKLGLCRKGSSDHPQDFFRDRCEWGLSNESGKKLWLPYGIVIPTLSPEGHVCKLKVRRSQWFQDDPLPKYVEISGSMLCPAFYGNIRLPIAIILESELDAILIQQEAGDLSYCVAIGGASKKPDISTHQKLSKTPLILWCLDNDEAGRRNALWWRETYRNLRFWPISTGKSPGDAYQYHGLNLRDWMLEGIKFIQSKNLH